jgi:regulator of replication initiation timing
MENYQGELPLSNVIKLELPDVAIEQAAAEVQRAEQIKENITRIFLEGYWYCQSHEGRCDRVESDHGQPPTCSRCGSVHIEYVPPLRVIEPQDLVEPKTKVTIV